jgi:penicillin-binding protein 2
MERDTVMAAIGQSDNMFNPLQLSNYIATILNGGDRYSAHILKEVREYGEGGSVVLESEPRVVSHIGLSDAALDTVKLGMRRMIQYDSAASGYMAGIPVTVGGKTGTAERGTDEDGNKKNDNRFFVCAAPYDDPEIVISVIIEPDDTKPKDNYHGSAYASYAAAETLKAYYNKE